MIKYTQFESKVKDRSEGGRPQGELTSQQAGQPDQTEATREAGEGVHRVDRRTFLRTSVGGALIAGGLTGCSVEEGVVNVPADQVATAESEAAQLPSVSLAELDNPIVAESLVGKPVSTEAHLKFLRRDVEWRNFLGLPAPSVFKYDKNTTKQIEVLTCEATDGKNNIYAVNRREYVGSGYMGFKEHTTVAPNPEDTYTLVGKITQGDVQLSDNKTVHELYLQVNKILQKQTYK